MEKKYFSVLLIIVSLTLILGLLPIHGENDIYDSVIRLHILANSDSEADQSLKLLVRDDVLLYVGGLVEGAKTRDEALVIVEDNLEKIEEEANDSLKAHGSEYVASARLISEFYPTKSYGKACFPCGEYKSLQIKIGEAEGQNWWCVLFPSLCYKAAVKKQDDVLEDTFVSVGLTPEQYRIITESNSNGKYKIRFKILEFFKDLANDFS